MTDVAIASTDLVSAAAGEYLGQQLAAEIGGAPDAVIVFASPSNDYVALLEALQRSASPGCTVGCSSAGEFTNDRSGEGLTCAIGLRSADMRFSASIGKGLSTGVADAANQLAAGFTGIDTTTYQHRTALVLTDALAGFAEEQIPGLTTATAGTYRFFGGGAGDDERFKSTHVFFGIEAHSNAAVALEILSNKPIGIGARHGWQPAGPALRVTESDQSNVVSLNVAPAVEAFEDHATSTSQTWNAADPMPFFLHNIVGVDTPSGYKLRVPLGVTESGAVVCAADVPTGATAHIMSTATSSAADAAVVAARDALDQVTSQGFTPRAALFFDCVATRLRLGQEFKQELSALSTELGNLPFAGFNSYGQIVRADGQFSGFHNCTAVVVVLPD